MNLSQENWVEGLEADSNAVILDVRTEDEVDVGKISGSINIDFHKGDEFIAQLELLDKTKNYYVYCRSGARSAQACSIMNQMGIDNAYNLVGGVLQWDGDLE